MTTQDLIARPLLKAKAINGSVQGGGQEEELVMELQPFAAAFSQGHWLLLDEVNLAPDQVLAVSGARQQPRSGCTQGIVVSRPTSRMDTSCYKVWAAAPQLL